MTLIGLKIAALYLALGSTIAYLFRGGTIPLWLALAASFAEGVGAVLQSAGRESSGSGFAVATGSACLIFNVFAVAHLAASPCALPVALQRLRLKYSWLEGTKRSPDLTIQLWIVICLFAAESLIVVDLAFHKLPR